MAKRAPSTPQSDADDPRPEGLADPATLVDVVDGAAR
jgi:hypothetical protein